MSKKKERTEKLQKEAREMYQNVPEEEKDKKRQFICEWYRNTSEEEKEKKRQYGREQCEKSSKGWV